MFYFWRVPTDVKRLLSFAAVPHGLCSHLRAWRRVKALFLFRQVLSCACPSGTAEVLLPSASPGRKPWGIFPSVPSSDLPRRRAPGPRRRWGWGQTARKRWNYSYFPSPDRTAHSSARRCRTRPHDTPPPPPPPPRRGRAAAPSAPSSHRPRPRQEGEGGREAPKLPQGAGERGAHRSSPSVHPSIHPPTLSALGSTGSGSSGPRPPRPRHFGPGRKGKRSGSRSGRAREAPACSRGPLLR